MSDEFRQPAALTALQAKSEAQKIAFSAIAFEAVVCMLRLGILRAVSDAGSSGARPEEIADQLGLSEYGVKVLLDMGLSTKLVWMNDERYVLDKVGHFLLEDRMTKVNIDFVQDVCYEAMGYLQESIETGTPAGLKVFGDWPTIYPGLTQLPEPARTSWSEFNCYYSRQAFPVALPILFATHPTRLLDDGQGRLWVATQSGLNLLDPEQDLPTGADTIWMSQFLDCFPERQIRMILERFANVMTDESSLFILETFWDCQEFDAATYSINATSLYFTCLANGTSRMYHSRDFIDIAQSAGFAVIAQHDNLGVGHTLLHLKKT